MRVGVVSALCGKQVGKLHALPVAGIATRDRGGDLPPLAGPTYSRAAHMSPPVLTYPFSALVGQEPMRTALLILAVDPGVGGVLVSGHKGTGKSTAVRALADILPNIQVVDGCTYHCDPDDPDTMEDDCRARAEHGLVRGVLATPLVELPLHATEDRLVGALHVEETLRSGVRRFEPGLLAAAHRGILYVDEVNLLADHLVDTLLDTAASGVNVVEREGVSVRHASRFMLVGTMNPEEGDLRPQLLDRFGLYVYVRGMDDEAQRREILRRRLAFDRDRALFRATWAERDALLGAHVVQARRRLSAVEVGEEVLALVVRVCVASGAQGHRAEIALLKAARALAALLDHAAVGPAEIAEAAHFVLPHRMSGNPLLTPETLAGRVDALLAGTFGATQPSADSSCTQDDDDEDMAESMQVPGSMAAGSILFELEKKSPKTESSTPMSASASQRSTSRG